MSRSVRLAVLLLVPVAAWRPLAAQPRGRPATPPVTVVETGIAELRDALAQGRVTSRQLVEQYLLRIARYEDRLNAIVTVNPRALDEADALDRERSQGRLRGPLHGIPVALKDNINTADLPTTGGALAFADFVPPYDATLTRQLREAGAILLAKTQLTELANFIAAGMPGNYNALTGFGMNPYDPRRDPREGQFDGRPVLGTGGSSSGVGTAVSFWAANVGTETSGSILSPAHQNMLVGLKPTVGRISRWGVIPITADQDTPGPMTRTVRDAAIMLGALEGAQPDPNDAATKACPPPAGRDYTKFLDPKALAGKRIGIPRAFFYDRLRLPGSTQPRGGITDAQRAVMDEVIATLKAQGAVVVDPADIPSVVDTTAAGNGLLWNTCGGVDGIKGRDADCSTTFKYGMKRDFNAYLATLGDLAPVKTLTALRQWNVAHQRAGAIRYGQANLDASDEMDVQADAARYQADRRKDLLLSATRGIDAVLAQHRLDALLFPGVSSAGIAAKPGYPSITVPYALLPVSAGGGSAGGGPGGGPFPAGFEPRPAPFGVTFTAGACAEPTLLGVAYAFEQATKKRQAPPLFP